MITMSDTEPPATATVVETVLSFFVFSLGLGFAEAVLLADWPKPEDENDWLLEDVVDEEEDCFRLVVEEEEEEDLGCADRAWPTDTQALSHSLLACNTELYTALPDALNVLGILIAYASLLRSVVLGSGSHNAMLTDDKEPKDWEGVRVTLMVIGLPGIQLEARPLVGSAADRSRSSTTVFEAESNIRIYAGLAWYKGAQPVFCMARVRVKGAF